MEQYTYEDEYRGQKRKLLILSGEEDTSYRVFSDAKFIGSISHEINNEKVVWKTEYNILKPIATKIGEWIENSN
ncbi:hypothetical protein [Pedobacter cryoconitis]|uniref:hypothetical protein n=1 Tax=Pedobacter cryoconitis TaxID=188932 RepID=UPI00161C41FF|nr:hypothetical protein [Pedobacter cryoconitis]MBB5647724.1 uncharacterized protein YukJ [Pedobacter cryoconitis]